jgi:membrane protein DedA with SNARE-associated domain
VSWELASWLLKPFVLLVAAGFCLHPIPEEVIIVGAGVSAGAAAEEHFYSRWLMLPVVILGAVIADLLLYGLGRLFGARLLKFPLFARLAPADKREHIRENLHRYGMLIFVIGRLVPGIRTSLFLTAGLMRLSFARFCIADGVGALVGNTLFFLLGFVLGSQFQELFERIERRLSPAKPIIILVLVLGVAGYLLYQFLRRPIPTGDPEELPIIGHQVATALPHRDPTPAPAEGHAQPQASPDA